MVETLSAFPSNIERYLKETWMAIAHMWADFGRLFFHEESETNNISER